MKRPKLTRNSFSQMLLIEKKWSNLKENSLIKDVEKLLNSKRKSVKEMINHLLLSTKKVLTQSVYKLLLMKISLL
jgi:hypothetical protein